MRLFHLSSDEKSFVLRRRDELNARRVAQGKKPWRIVLVRLPRKNK